MRITDVELFTVSLPLKRRITHESASRQESQNVFARCTLASGVVGWGEGVPRPYVTGETPETAHQQFAATDWAGQLGRSCAGWADVVELCEGLRPRIAEPDVRGCGGHALRCALELSILDAFGREFGQPLAEVTRHFPPAAAITASHPAVRYSTTITAGTPLAELTGAWKMRLYGFHQCKVKVGLAGADDGRRLRRIRRVLGARCDLRVDANEAWCPEEAVQRIRALEPFCISSVEQPVPHGAIDAMPAIRSAVAVPLMLDESLTSLSDAQHAIRERICDLFNIRLSKCGGFLNSLRIAALAQSAGLGYQLGCHPGESGILSAAGRHFAVSVRGLRYLEGSYDRHLLRERLIREDITFGYGGRAPALSQPGLGVQVEEAAIMRLANQQSNWRR
jgi:muconate cycloisomerase